MDTINHVPVFNLIAALLCMQLCVSNAYYVEYYNYYPYYNSGNYYQSTTSSCPCPNGFYSTRSCTPSLVTTSTGCPAGESCTTLKNQQSYCCSPSFGQCANGQQSSIPCNPSSNPTTCATGTSCTNTTSGTSSGFAYCCPLSSTNSLCPNGQTSNIACIPGAANNGGCGSLLSCNLLAGGNFCCAGSTTAASAISQARVNVRSPVGSQNFQGSFMLVQTAQTTTPQMQITGTVLSSIPGTFGIHIHKLADGVNGCVSTGADFNPDNTQHGGPNTNPRHAGDLGNIVIQTPNQNTSFAVTVNNLAFSGKYSVIGRALVIHAAPDNFQPINDGNTDGYLACGNIGIAVETP